MEPTKKTILLVEDEDVMRITLAGALETAGYEVLQAPDGEAGLALAQEKHPALILTDLKMPKMGGLQMIQALRTDAWGKDVEIIILTNVSDAEALDRDAGECVFLHGQERHQHGRRRRQGEVPHRLSPRSPHTQPPTGAV
jgi:CheY-like chemotaxis protein